jgi:hypothetical protein
MTTSGTAAVDFNLVEICEEAFERCGRELRTGYDLKTARRSLNLLFMEWANRGVNLWTIEAGTIPLVSGTATYDLPVDTVDLLEHVIRTGTGTNQSDLSIERISADNYANISNKNAPGRPSQIWINRQGGQTDPTDGIRYPTVTLYQVPNTSTYTLAYWRFRRVQDAAGGGLTADVPFRFIPALISGLAYHLALKLPDGMSRIEYLKAIYEEEFLRAADEDREKDSFIIRPRRAR